MGRESSLGRIRYLVAIVLVVVSVAMLAACGGDEATDTPAPTQQSTSTSESTVAITPTPTPSSPPTSAPAPTPTATPRPTPVPTPASTATPTPEVTQHPAELTVDAFLQQCAQGNLALAVPLAGMPTIDMNQIGQDENVTWGEFAAIFGAVVTAYSEFNPPAELQAYHDAWVQTAAAVRDNANSRPSGGSFIEELFILLFEAILPASMEIGFDPDKTDAEKQQLVEEVAQEALGEFFGPDFVAAGMAYDEAKAALSAETLALLENSDCYFGISPLSGMEGSAGPGFDQSFDDDHADTLEEATIIAVGEPLDGMVDYEGDFDFFRFRAEQDVVYLIDVQLEIVADWTVALYDSEGQQLDFGFSVPLFWEAPDSDDYYTEINVWTADPDTYTVTVSAADDDHGNSLSNSSRIAIGESAQSSIDYETDLDYFVIEAEEGQSYRITVEPGTLPDTSLTLYDVDGMIKDFGVSSLDWQASISGDYYIEAAAFGDTGTYTLSVTASAAN